MILCSIFRDLIFWMGSGCVCMRSVISGLGGRRILRVMFRCI